MPKAGLIYVDHHTLVQDYSFKKLYLMVDKLCMVNPLNRLMGNNMEENRNVINKLKDAFGSRSLARQRSCRNLDDISFLKG